MMRLRAVLFWVGVVCLTRGEAVAQEATAAEPESQPLWEIGPGVAGLSIPRYRGSDERYRSLAPFPFIVYRGHWVKASDGNVRGLFYANENLELNVSALGSPPVESDEVDARAGMDDLDASLEIGPAMRYNLKGSSDDPVHVQLRTPLRAVFSSDFSSVQSRGWKFNPHLNLDYQYTLRARPLHIGLATGPVFASAEYHDYFYGVDAEDATATRAVYQGRSGYSGWRSTASISTRRDHLWLGAYAVWNNLDGAVQTDSDLVVHTNDFTLGFGVAWVLKQSKTQVSRNAD